jgi:hypothetical protein
MLDPSDRLVEQACRLASFSCIAARGAAQRDVMLIAQMIGWQKQIVIHPAPHLN